MSDSSPTGAHPLLDDLGAAVGGEALDLARGAVEDERMLQAGAGVRQVDKLPGRGVEEHRHGD